MKKALLYKPQTEDIDVSVVAYANEAWVNWGCSKNTSGCGGKRSDEPKKGIDIFFCKRGENGNRICPKH